MNIAINASLLDEKQDGARVYTLNIIREILNLPESKKHKITIFTPLTRYFKESKNIEIVKIPELMLNSKYGKIAPLFRFLWNNIHYSILAKKFDISYCPTANGSLFLKNQIMTIHDLMPFRYPKTNRMRTYYFKVIIPLMLRKAKKVLTTSQFTREDINKNLKYPLNRIEIIPCSYDPRVFKINKSSRKEKIILLIGASYEYKNFDKVILAYSTLPEEIKKEYKVFIGGGREKYLSKLRKMIHHLDLNNKVVIGNWISENKLVKKYQEASIFIYPSLFEGFGIPPLEAMACGCPTALSNIAPIKEVCGDAGYYFNPNSAKEIKIAIINLLKNEKLRKDLIKRGFKRAKLFSWKNSAKKVLSILEAS